MRSNINCQLPFMCVVYNNVRDEERRSCVVRLFARACLARLPFSLSTTSIRSRRWSFNGRDNGIRQRALVCSVPPNVFCTESIFVFRSDSRIAYTLPRSRVNCAPEHVRPLMFFVQLLLLSHPLIPYLNPPLLLSYL